MLTDVSGMNMYMLYLTKFFLVLGCEFTGNGGTVFHIWHNVIYFSDILKKKAEKKSLQEG